jgi:hypothetical protein
LAIGGRWRRPDFWNAAPGRSGNRAGARENDIF